MMMIAPNSRAFKEEKERGEVKGEYGGIRGEEGNTDYGGMVQPSQQYDAPCMLHHAICCTRQRFGPASR